MCPPKHPYISKPQVFTINCFPPYSNCPPSPSISPIMAANSDTNLHEVNFCKPRSFVKAFRSDVKDTLFPDDPFRQLPDESQLHRAKKTVQYFIPIFDWLPKYNLRMFRFDLISGITIASLAIPQGISYAKLAQLPIVIGLYSSFVPPLIYAVFGSSKHLAVGPIASASVFIAATISEKVSSEENPTLYLHLIYTTTFISGILQTALGFLRLGVLVDFLSHSTIVGFMAGTATIVCLQQLKGMLGMRSFTSRTDVVSVIKSVITYRDEWRWECALVGSCFLAFLQLTRYMRRKSTFMFWVAAMAPLACVVVGCIFSYVSDGERFGIQIVGHLSKGLNPISIYNLNFSSNYISAPLKAGITTGLLALAEGVAIGRSFAVLHEDQVDGNKETIAFGLMNIIGSFTSCYLTTGPFSKTAVNVNAGCKSAMSNVVMAVCMMVILLFMAPLFSHTPLVALSAVIMSAMFGLIKYEKAIHLFKVDKFDFCICMTAFFGVAFLSMDIGLILSIGLALVRALLYVARPSPCKLGSFPNTNLYRDLEQYPGSINIPGTLILQLGSPIYFPNCTYVRERISNWVRVESLHCESKGSALEHVILDLGGVTSIDMNGIEMLSEMRKSMRSSGIKLVMVNPRLEVLEKMMVSKFVDSIGKQSVFLSIDDAIHASQCSLDTCPSNGEDGGSLSK